MNIVFWALVVLGAAALWFALSSHFWEIGEAFTDMFRDAKDAINEEKFKEDE